MMRAERLPATPVDVHVSIVTHKNPDLLFRCLDSLSAACAGISSRLTVTDNVPIPGTSTTMADRFPTVELIENPSPAGFGRNHNRALAAVLASKSARYVLVLNDDIELEAGSVTRLVRFCDERRDVAAAGPLVLDGDRASQISLFPFPTVRGEVRYEIAPGRPCRTRRAGDWLNGCCILLRTSVVREVGLWDERFFLFYEDVDLGYRLVRAGWKVALCPEARIVHLGHASISRSDVEPGIRRQMFRSRYLYFRKHHGRVRAALVVNAIRIVLLGRCAKAHLVGLLSGDSGERAHGRALWQLASYRPRAH